MSVCKKGCWMRVELFLSFTYIQHPRKAVCRNNLTKNGAVGQSHIVAGANLDFLNRVAVAIDHRTGGLTGLLVSHELHPLHKIEPCNRTRLIEKIFLGEIAQAEVLPPVSLLFSAMPIEQVRNPPARPRFRRELRCFWRHISKQPLSQCRNALFPFAHGLRGLSFFRSRSRYIGPFLSKSRTLHF